MTPDAEGQMTPEEKKASEKYYVDKCEADGGLQQCGDQSNGSSDQSGSSSDKMVAIKMTRRATKPNRTR